MQALLKILILFCIASPLLAQEGQTTAETQTGIQTEAPPLQPLVLSIQYGKGGTIQEFRLKSGEAVFVPTGKPQTPANQQNPQQTKEANAYQQQLGQVSQKIADQITAIQRKQKELDTEIYPTYRAPLDVEVKALQHDLNLLEAQRNQLQSQQVAKEAQKSLQPSPPPPTPTVATGMTVRPVLQGTAANLTIQIQGKAGAATTITTPINTWVQIFSAEKGQGVDIWSKVAPSE